MNCGLRMASEGANVALFDIVEDKLNEAVEKVKGAAKENAKVIGVVADVTKPEKVEEAFATVEKELGVIHYCFNNAGYQGKFAMTQNYDVNDF